MVSLDPSGTPDSTADKGAASQGISTEDTLYRRFRPRRFQDVIGQDRAVAALQNAVASGKGPHAYLLTGPRGCGKTTLARIFARGINCLNLLEAEPCGICVSCKAIDAGNSFDLLELDAASNNGVDDVRMLTSKLNLSPTGKFRVVILDEAHMLSGAAANALLKSLEEPPKHVKFVLATTDANKLLPTIRSRTATLDLQLVSPDLLEPYLEKVAKEARLNVSKEMILEAVRSAKGSVRDALSSLEVVAASGLTGPGDLSLPLLDAVISLDRLSVLKAIASSLALGMQPRVLAEQTLSNLRDLFLVQMDAANLVDSPDDGKRLSRAQKLGARHCVMAMDALGNAILGMRSDYDARVHLEVNLARFCAMASA